MFQYNSLCDITINMKQKSKRFVFTLPSEVYDLLRHHAINRNIPMSRYILQAIISAIKLEIE